MKEASRVLSIFIFASLASIALCQAASLGVSPPYKEFSYEPGAEVDVTFSFYSSDASLDYYVILDGELKEYFTTSVGNFTGSGDIRVTGTLPQEQPTPGRHDVGVYAKQVQPRGGGGFGGVPSVGGLIVIRVPYPGKYLEGTFEVGDINQGGKAPYSLTLYSRGSEEVASMSRVEIIDIQNKTVLTIQIGEDVVPSGSNIELKDHLDVSSLPAGTYTAKMTSEYSGGQIIKEDPFRIGELKIEIVDFTKNSTGGSIVPFFVEVESSWNEVLRGVYADVLFEGIPPAKTSPADINALGKTRLEGFVDLSSVEEEKILNGKIVIHYSDYTSEEEASIIVGEPEFGVNYLYVALGFVILLLIALFIIVFVMYKKLMNKNGKKKK